ncbi:uncharacterized protein si:ch73-364h19.1 [Betta splendens]|uniref:Uncharacterized protein si:ch73-364h19.1 n=1 Tax=Betta splendens TaxID=158456 RepID=A0A8M1HGY9_BETSP|nr:uncharacterized protein si:ch73-364h19.1 [Betta splendens]
MSAIASPTLPTSLLSSYQLTVIAASVSSLVFFVVIVLVLSIIYRKDPVCCRPCSYQGPRADTDAPPQYYSSRQTLVAAPCLEPQTTLASSAVSGGAQRADQLFFVGPASSYGLAALDAPLPRLPSYESVRKKDRQRHIHMMIAHRFGLNGPIVTEPPPTYEESIRQSMVLPYNILSSGLETGPGSEVHTDAHSSVLPV